MKVFCTVTVETYNISGGFLNLNPTVISFLGPFFDRLRRLMVLPSLRQLLIIQMQVVVWRSSCEYHHIPILMKVILLIDPRRPFALFRLKV